MKSRTDVASAYIAIGDVDKEKRVRFASACRSQRDTRPLLAVTEIADCHKNVII